MTKASWTVRVCICLAVLASCSSDVVTVGAEPTTSVVVQRLVAGTCLPGALPLDPSRRVACVIVEARRVETGCDCSIPPRRPVDADRADLVAVIRADPLAAAAGWDCFCDVPQATDAELDTCQNDAADPPTLAGNPLDTWCYIDATTTPPTGNVSFVQACPRGAQHQLRFLGDANALVGSTMFLACGGD